jgi:hypothetical protein
MSNAKQELLEAVKDTAKIKCASIAHRRWEDEASKKVLKLNHTNDEYNEFLNSLDFEYDSGYGGQELYGTVWLEDGTWLSRGEYDGSEWWEHNVLPAIPAECL